MVGTGDGATKPLVSLCLRLLWFVATAGYNWPEIGGLQSACDFQHPIN